jgi:hypothetical protein
MECGDTLSCVVDKHESLSICTTPPLAPKFEPEIVMMEPGIHDNARGVEESPLQPVTLDIVGSAYDTEATLGCEKALPCATTIEFWEPTPAYYSLSSQWSQDTHHVE